MFIQLRRRIAGKFGRNEHHFAEYLGFVLTTLSIAHYILKYPVYRTEILICTIFWWIYYVSHRLEKATYGKIGYR